MLRTKLLTAGVLVAAPLAAWGASAYADAPTALPALSVAPNPVIPEGQLVVRGSGCVGSGGTPGVVSVALRHPDGSSSVSTVTAVDASGGWATAYTAPAAAGTYQITATCDLYSTATPYAAASVTVVPGGGSAPAAGASTAVP
uniref:hypothetical protein n=1 Tax=Cumulibacter manganitolerans TaxID=1884992 RepID=UPI00129502B7